MPGSVDVTASQSYAINDPGEGDRSQQTWADRLVIHLANATAWLLPVLMIAITTQVVIRKLGFNQAWLDDAQWWIYGFAMTVGFVYAITTQSHVRVDILHVHFNEKKKARIEVFGLGWLLLPFLAMMADILMHYGWASVLAGEGSDSPNGLHRLYLLKMSLPVIFVIGMLATISMLNRHLALITPVRFWTVLIGIFPAAWFIAERVCYYSLWWFVRLTNSEVQPRRIAREPLLEPTMWYGLAVLLIAILVSFIVDRRRAHQG